MIENLVQVGIEMLKGVVERMIVCVVPWPDPVSGGGLRLNGQVAWALCWWPSPTPVPSQGPPGEIGLNWSPQDERWGRGPGTDTEPEETESGGWRVNGRKRVFFRSHAEGWISLCRHWAAIEASPP